MTICEFFKNQYDAAIEKGCGTSRTCQIDQTITPKGTWEWVKIAHRYFFGGAYQPELERAGITIQQLKAAKENGYLKYTYYTNWQARQLKQTDLWQLTNKGLKALYKAYAGQW